MGSSCPTNGRRDCRPAWREMEARVSALTARLELVGWVTTRANSTTGRTGTLSDRRVLFCRKAGERPADSVRVEARFDGGWELSGGSGGIARARMEELARLIGGEPYQKESLQGERDPWYIRPSAPQEAAPQA